MIVIHILCIYKILSIWFPQRISVFIHSRLLRKQNISSYASVVWLTNLQADDKLDVTEVLRFYIIYIFVNLIWDVELLLHLLYGHVFTNYRGNISSRVSIVILLEEMFRYYIYIDVCNKGLKIPLVIMVTDSLTLSVN